MPRAVSLLIKPASGNCNMRCRYCFYTDITQNRAIESFGMMTPETLEIIVQKALAHATRSCSFAFQGGEPTLAGLEFYRKLIGFQKQYNTRRLEIYNAIQTNGMVIDREWAEFLAEHHFLVGLSLDGTKAINDGLRPDASGNGTYRTVQRTAQLFDSCGVEYNLLTVISAQVAANIGEIYGFYKRSGLHYQQYIPCLDPIGEERGQRDYSLTPRLYGEFLKRLFDLWYNDISRGEFIYIRYFENLVGMLRGIPPESCGLSGHCSLQNVVEADGGVYPCDFYVLDRYRVGSLVTDSFAQIEEQGRALGFLESSLAVDPACLECRWGSLCRGGCRRDRDYGTETLGRSYFCESYQTFFDYAYPRLRTLAEANPASV